MSVETMVAVFVCGAAILIYGQWAYRLGLKRGRSQARIISVAKMIDNRVMPDYTRAERRAYKRRARSG